MPKDSKEYKELNIERKRLSMVLEGSQQGFWDWDIETDKVTRNDYWAQMLGYKSIQEFESNVSSWTTSVHAEDKDSLLSSIADHIEGRTESHSVEYRMWSKEGKIVWVLDHAKIVERGLDNNPLRMSGTHTNITELKNLQNSFKEANVELSNQVNELKIINKLAIEQAELAKSNTELLNAIQKVHSMFISSSSTKDIFDNMLKCLLELTKSEYGFIGEVLYYNNVPYLKTYAITDISWSEETKNFYEENAPKGLIFNNLETLFGEILTTEKTVVSNHPFLDSRSGGLPEGHPNLDCFLGLPIFSGDEFCGAVGIANRPQGYDTHIVEYLQPFLSTCANMIDALKVKEVREKIQHDLEISEERVSFALEANRDGVWDWDLVQDKVSFSDRWKTMLGYSVDEIEDDFAEWRSRVHPEELEYAISNLYSYLEGKLPFYQSELRLLCKDGSYKWVLTRGNVVKRNRAGEPLRVIGTHTDLTQSKTLEKNLKRSEEEKERGVAELVRADSEIIEQAERFSAVIDNIVDGIITITEQGTVETFNRAAMRIFGYSEEEILGKNVKILMPEPYKNGHDDYLDNHIKTGDKKIIGIGRELTAIRKDGSIFPMELAVSSIQVNDVRRFVGIIRDITERKQWEETLQKAKIEADAANKAKGEFLANMSHEIRTPLNGVIGLNYQLLRTPLDDNQFSYAKTIQDSAESLLSLINDILDFSKIEAGMLEIEPIEFDLEVLLRESGRSVALSAHEKSLELICPANLVPNQWFLGDPGRIRQIFVNLLDNAIKFTEEGEVAVYCSVVSETPLQSLLKFEITDTGVGLTEEACNALFERFRQADSSTTRKYGGTGLGLTIIKHLVSMMGGEIDVDSVEGEGSTFWFTLNLDKVQKPIYTTVKRIDKSILVVIEHPTTRTLIEQILNRWQVQYTMVDKGGKVMETLQEAYEAGDPYTIVLMDILESPTVNDRINSRQLAILIKESAQLRHTKLLLLTSEGRGSNARRAEDRGFDYYLGKPIDQSVLYNALLKLSGDKERVTSRNKSVYTEKLVQFEGRALIVEDNVVNQIVAQRLLEGFGLSTVVVSDGEKAVKAIEDSNYDIVFMDCQMPVMDGYEATSRIRDSESKVINRHIPIIAMTANNMLGDREKCLAVGMDDFIAKPVKPSKLESALHTWLNGVDK